VVEAYKNIELAKHEAEIDHILYSHHDYKNFVDARVVLSSPIISYLSSSRFFIDSSRKILKNILSDEKYNSFGSYVNEIYDTSEEYRFIEAVRNYVQHNDLPIHQTTYHNFHDDNNIESTGMVTSLSLFTFKEELKNDDLFKKSVLKEIPDKVNIIYFIRCHMEGIWKQFDFIKETLLEVGDESRSVIQKAFDDFNEKTESRTKSLYAIANEDNGSVIEKIPLFTKWYDTNRESMSNLGNLNNLHRRYATGRIIEK